jgi:hypothetical protein
MTKLIEHKAPRQRFARSLNVERDSGSSALDGYLPVGRAIEAISRLAAALDHDDVEVALSITGPYGSGKSSLALLIDALLGPSTDAGRKSAEEILFHADWSALEKIRSARKRLGADKQGFIRAVVTAQREPIAATVVRALTHGTERFRPNAKQKAAHVKLLRQLRAMEPSLVHPEVREIREVVASLGELAPVLLLVDEFGKNLEAFADAPSEADLFLLQELAEWTRGGDGIPLAVVTLQHMAFDEYATGTSAAQRREWAKIQGRFEDIPFVDSPAQTRALIAAAFDDPSAQLQKSLRKWSAAESSQLLSANLADLASDPDLLARCWPLHPVALALLPDLCERYGQNERTLFSFLAGHEPLSVASFLRETDRKATGDLPTVRLDRVYDYFVDSAATMVAVSSAASRWVEIDTRIRDARGVDDAGRRVLKAIGILNLVSAGGTLRASAPVVEYVVADGQLGTASREEVAARLVELEAAGLVTYRDFADEYRVWQGSDFDLRSAVDVARRRLRDEPDSVILGRVLDLPPLVAARHSHRSGTLRAFERSWVDPDATELVPLGSEARPDGTLYYVLGDSAPTGSVGSRSDAKPVVFATSTNSGPLVDAARELAAVDEVLSTTEDLEGDWVARRELIERRIEARSSLEQQFEAAYGAEAETALGWTWSMRSSPGNWMPAAFLSASAAVSAIADDWYAKAPIVRNDLVNRHELSSQAARARRELLEAMLAAPGEAGLGIEGFGPARTMYLTVLDDLGLHRKHGAAWEFVAPTKSRSVYPSWARMNALLDEATTSRRRALDIYDALAAPPYGVRAGVAPILLLAALIVRSEDIALYEHGTFRPVLSAEVCERFIRNPANFEVKYFASKTGQRAELLTAMVDALGISARRGARNSRVGSVLAVLSNLVALVNSLNDYARKTTQVSADAIAIRKALVVATEPDELLFVAIPEALGYPPVAARRGGRSAEAQAVDVADVAERVGQVARELKAAYPSLLVEVLDALREELRGDGARLHESLSARAKEITGKVIDPQIARLVVALTAEIPGDDEWAEYVAMNVTGTPPGAWSDADRTRFFSQLHDLGGTFRRIEALNSDMRSHGDGFDAVRITVTRPDGAESAKLVWIDDAKRDAAGTVLAEALAKIAGLASSDAEARDLFMALLAEGDLSPAKSNAASEASATVRTITSVEGTA